MVRLLLSASFFLANAAYAHNSNCQNHLNIPQIRTLTYLKNLQKEVDSEYPAEKFNRVALGRSMGPLVAALEHGGNPVAQIPLEMNFDRLLHGQPLESFMTLLDAYLPPPATLANKPLVVLVYAESPDFIIYFAPQMVWYLQTRNIKVPYVQYKVFSPQMSMRHMKTRLAQSMFSARGDRPAEYSLRPMSNHNEVRHWFRDGLRSDLRDFNASPYPTVDVYDPAARLTKPNRIRQQYTQLLRDLSSSEP